MKHLITFLILLSSTLVLGGCLGQNTAPSPSGSGAQTTQEAQTGETYTIEMTKNGFSPSILRVEAGDTVQFIPTDDGTYWPASDKHPTHTLYPGSDIQKCRTDEAASAFDTCKGISKNQTYAFTFTQKGTWGYHDHLSPKQTGTIVVGDASTLKKEGTMDVNTGSVMYFPGNKQYQGFLARPSGSGKYPALILIHEWWGLNDNIKKLAQDFAKEGYIVLAVDLYGKPATTDQQVAMQMAESVSKDMPLAFRNLGYAVEFLKTHPDVDPKKIGSVGWCFGGGWAYQMAKNNLGTRASVMYYGRFNPADDLKMMRSQILGHFGEKDVSITIDSVHEFQAKLNTLSGSTSMLYIYPNAGHSFANEGGNSYDKEASDLAWKRTLDFLERTVKNGK